MSVVTITFRHPSFPGAGTTEWTGPVDAVAGCVAAYARFGWVLTSASTPSVWRLFHPDAIERDCTAAEVAVHAEMVERVFGVDSDHFSSTMRFFS